MKIKQSLANVFLAIIILCLFIEAFMVSTVIGSIVTVLAICGAVMIAYDNINDNKEDKEDTVDE